MTPFFLLALHFLAQLAPPTKPSIQATPVAASAPAAPFEIETYQLVILERPEHPQEYPESRLEEIQKAHLAHIRQMEETGQLLVAGPFGDQPDPRLRGIELFRVGSVQEAKRLAEDDPAVKAGRLIVVAMSWYTQKGALAFPLAEKHRKP